MKPAVSIIAVVVLLFAPHSAHAGWRIGRATAIARIVWHHPCVDRMTIRWVDFRSLTEQRLRQAKAFSTPDDCTVYLNAGTNATWGDTCYELLHEAGHLAGYRDPVGIEPLEGGPIDHDHSPNPHSIMYPSPTTLENDGHIADDADPRCRDRGRPFLEAHGLL